MRAWPIPDGSNAVDAAGAIHTDLARGFIRAETIGYEDLLAMGSIAEAKKHGKVRSEGKTYRVRDGDVIEILFSRLTGCQLQGAARSPPAGPRGSRGSPRCPRASSRSARKFSSSSRDTLTAAVSRSSVIAMNP